MSAKLSVANEGGAVPRKFVEPERAHYGIGDIAMDKGEAVRLLDQQAGQHQECGTRHVEEGPHAVGENVVHAGAPAIGEGVSKATHDPIGHHGLEVRRYARKGIECDRPLEVAGIDENEIVRARSRDVLKRGARELTVWVEQGETGSTF